jgi:acid phosphatase (class A)
MKNRHLQSWLRFAPVLFALAVCVAPVQAREAQYLPAGQPDPVALLAAPPLPGSPEEAADLAEVRSVCRAAPGNEVSDAMAERKFSVFTFAPAVGDFFRPGNYPKTGQFFHQVQKDAANATDDAKEIWKRPRPCVLDPTLAAGKLEKSFSYPSGHSTESMVLALLLADLFPGKRDAILAEARRIGWHRVEIARHYPTDIYAGRVFARAIVREMKKNPAFQANFAAVKAEIAALPQAARN